MIGGPQGWRQESCRGRNAESGHQPGWNVVYGGECHNAVWWGDACQWYEILLAESGKWPESGDEPFRHVKLRRFAYLAPVGSPTLTIWNGGPVYEAGRGWRIVEPVEVLPA